MVTTDFRAARTNNGPPSIALALIFKAWDGALWLPRFWKRRSELAFLAEMGRHALQDIGLTPLDVANAFEQPGDRDATAYLADIVRDRRLRKEQ